MQVTRRDALKLAAASLVSFILPAPRKQLDLMAYCAKRPRLAKYTLTLPYNLADWVYATEGHICVRVRPETADVEQATGRIPPFETLSWNHDRLRGWRSLPKLEPLLAKDSPCTACEGYGLEGGDVFQECETCQGCGQVWTGTDYASSYPVQCRACKGKGHVKPPGAKECGVCKGEAYGVLPSVVNLEGRHFDARLYELARATGGEYTHSHWHAMPYPLMKFAFDGGHGLLMGLDGATIERRLVK